MLNKIQMSFIWVLIFCAISMLCFISISHAQELNIKDPKSFLMERIPLFEGFSATRYGDSVTKGCILQGYGRCVNNMKTPATISKSTANKWLAADLIKCEKKLDTHLPWWRNASIVRRAALLDMTYNMGIDKLKTFKQFLRHMQNQNYALASKSLTDSRWAKQVGVRSREIRHAIKHDKWVAMKK